MPPATHDTLSPAPNGVQTPAPSDAAETPERTPSPNPFNPVPELDPCGIPITTPTRPHDFEEKLRSGPAPLSLFPIEEESRLKEAFSSFTTNQHQSTPFTDRTGQELKPNPKRDEHKKLIKLELGTVIALKDNGAWAVSLYDHLVSKAEINEFLAECGLWSSDCWTALLNPSKEADLYSPFVNITNAILEKFVLNACKQGELPRMAIDTNTENLPHQEETKTKLWSRPDISIKGEGSSFQVPEEDAEGETAEVGFSNMASFEEIKLDKAKCSPAQQGLQVGVYVRQIFIHQPNRKFVRVLVLTETTVRLFHFDRSGGTYTPEINIHKDPYTFVRLVVGLNSLDESAIGFDVSIEWTIEDGRKVGGTLTTLKKDETEIKYNLSKVDPVITFFDIRGRGTQCWSVFDPTTGDKLLVKDSWTADDRVPEYEHLEELKGVQGVAQMLSFEPNRGETKDFRATLSTSHHDFQNRIAIRIVMSSYGESIESFRSPTELLCAFRDAIKGHMNLYKTQRLHRDVTIHNVLLGRKPDGSDPDPGYCGILIDLYMAIESKRLTLSAEQRAGSRLFLSVALLKSCKDPVDNEDEDDNEEEEEEEEEEEQLLRLAHDHLDDLEAFLYIYIYIIHVYDASGASYSVPSLMKGWKRDRPSAIVNSKFAFLKKKAPVLRKFAKRWPAQCITLLESFVNFIAVHVDTKIALIDHPEYAGNTHSEATYKLDEVVNHYNAVLHLFNEAIEELEEHQPDSEEGNTNRFRTPPPDPNSPTTSQYRRHNMLKRMGDYLDERPWARRRSSPGVPEEAMKLPLPPDALPNKTPTKGQKCSLSHLAKL